MNCNHKPEDAMGLGAKRYTRGIILNRVSDLENDLGFITLEELNNLLGGGTSDNPLLVNLTQSLTADQIAQVKLNLRIFEFAAEEVKLEADSWKNGYVDDPTSPNWVVYKNEEGLNISQAIGGMVLNSITFDQNKFNKQVTFSGTWSGGEQTARINWKERDEINGYRIEGLNGLCFWIAFNVDNSILTLYLSDAYETNKREELGTFTKSEG